jgi:hypothetical protein
MRDIRHDLRERLAALNGRYLDAMALYQAEREALDNGHRVTITALERERTAVEQLLAIEEERQGFPPAAVQARKTARLVALDDFLVTKVHAHGPMDKDHLRAEANLAGYFAEGNGRKFHITLMNVTRCGRLVRLSDGKYAFPERQPPMFDESVSEEAETHRLAS